MLFSQVLFITLASTAIAAPVAEPAPLPEASPALEERQLFALLGDHAKRDVKALNDIERRQLIAGLSTPLSQLLTLLGLGAVAPPVTGILDTVDTTVQGITGALSGDDSTVTDPLKRDLSDIERRQLLGGLSDSLSQLFGLLGLGAIGAPVTDLVGTVDTTVQGALDDTLQGITDALGNIGNVPTPDPA